MRVVDLVEIRLRCLLKSRWCTDPEYDVLLGQLSSLRGVELFLQQRQRLLHLAHLLRLDLFDQLASQQGEVLVFLLLHPLLELLDLEVLELCFLFASTAELLHVLQPTLQRSVNLQYCAVAGDH